MIKSNSKISLFASTLKSLLDKTGLFDRKEWSEALGVSELEINQWVNDEDIPSADTLLMIILMLDRSSELLPTKKQKKWLNGLHVTLNQNIFQRGQLEKILKGDNDD